ASGCRTSPSPAQPRVARSSADRRSRSRSEAQRAGGAQAGALPPHPRDTCAKMKTMGRACGPDRAVSVTKMRFPAAGARVIWPDGIGAGGGRAMTVRVAINGFGRIGRSVLRASLADPQGCGVEIVAVNDIAKP